MLNKTNMQNKLMVHRRERGLVLVMVMIVMVAMMFAGVAMLRSVDTATLIAGNMSFRQAATHQGDIGIETAAAWLGSQNAATSTVLQSDHTANGYYSKLINPASNQSWDNYWSLSLDPTPVARPVSAAVNSGNVYTLATVNGYTVSYVIHRMCPLAGVPGATTNTCTASPTGGVLGSNSHKAGQSFQGQANAAVYYRITSRIEGPRNTVSYVQAVVSM